MKNLNFIMPDDLHRKFRLKLFEEGKTIKEFILTVVRLYVEDEGNGDKSKKDRKKNKK
ncbi:hypothetical protein ES702_06842 [subsurface metagenome]